ncbi:MAG: hypothetical protein ACFFAK_00085 [Promethearchaeota archaeon]
MPEYIAEIKFHIFPYRKFKFSAKNKNEARKLASDQVEQIINSLSYTIKSLKQKQTLIDDFL